jgi:hypothetical protein
MSKTPSKQSYEQALETVKAYEKRQAQLQSLKETLSIKLKAFENVSFKVDKKKGEVLFAGYLKEQSKTKIGKSVCAKEDKFEEVIGKLIAVKKALGEDVEDVIKLVEPKATGGFTTLNVGSLTLGTGGLNGNGRIQI